MASLPVTRGNPAFCGPATRARRTRSLWPERSGARPWGPLALAWLLSPAPSEATVTQVDGSILPQTPGTMQGYLDAQGEGGAPAETALDAVLDADRFPEVFLPNTAAPVTFRLVGEGGGFENSFGWYNVGDDIRTEAGRARNLHPVLGCGVDMVAATGAENPASMTDAQLLSPPHNQHHHGEPASFALQAEPGAVVTIDFGAEQAAGRYKGSFIAFYLISPEGHASPVNCGDFKFDPLGLNLFGRIYHSQADRNNDGDYVHHLAYTSKRVADRFYFGFEDLFRGGDNDFEDVLTQVTGLSPLCSPTLEICDEVDNDCDSLIDDADPDLFGVGAPCVCDDVALPCEGGARLGPCRSGTTVCRAGEIRCVPLVSPSAEICDGIDNNCNGIVDDVPGPCLTEICNGLDDDGDGLTDELPLPDLGAPCGIDEGECSRGVTCCAEGGVLGCCGQDGPTSERCDCLDNDCDGVTDEGDSRRCYEGPSSECDVETGVCEGICRFGTETCVTTGCPAAPAFFCAGPVGPRPEECNCLDDDCDGETDDGATCDNGAPCVDCACAVPCDPSEEFPCSAESVCRCACDESLPCFCEPDPCLLVACEPGESCDSCTGTCIDPCADCREGTTCCSGECCGPSETCLDGRCRTCADPRIGCPEGEICVLGECVGDDCVGVDCGSGRFCRSGECRPVCPDCPEGSKCRDGACVADLCTDVFCQGAAQVCCDGVCAHDLCVGQVCGVGESCDPCEGVCVEDPCARTACPVGYSCSRGDCVPAAERDFLDVAAGGVAGCSCTAGGSPPRLPWLVLCAIGVAAVRRRRWRVRPGRVPEGSRRACGARSGGSSRHSSSTHLQYAPSSVPRHPRSGPRPTRPAIVAPPLTMWILAVGGLASGCDVRSVRFFQDAGGWDGGSEVPVPENCQPFAEVCNGADDDCDGRIDDGDPGGGNICGIAQGACRQGVTACSHGQVICSEDVRPEAETCDELDNDCDGQTDEPFDFCSSPANCGSCFGSGAVGRSGPCAIPHAIAACDSSGCPDDCEGCAVCRIETCESGWTDCQDDDPPNDCDCPCSISPGPEACDGIDNDCNGTTDEDLFAACYTGPPGTLNVGRCREGSQACVGGVFSGPCAGEVTPGVEACNGFDDSCDGTIDEDSRGEPLALDCYDGPGPTEGVGTCVGGTRTCTFGTWGPCEGQVVPEAERCGDDLDTDCDGVGDVAEGCASPTGVEARLDEPGGPQGSGAGQFHSYDMVMASGGNPAGRTVYVAWTDLTRGLADVFLRRSTDGGSTFRDIQNLTVGSPNASVVPRLAAAYDPGTGRDRVVVVYQSLIAGLRRIVVLRSEDGGDSFSFPATPTDGLLDVGGGRDSFHHDVSMGPAGAHVFVVWEEMDAGSVTRRVKSRASSNFGVDFAPEREVTVASGASPEAGRPIALVTDLDRLVVVWREQRVPAATSDIFSNWSDDTTTPFAGASEMRVDGDAADRRVSDRPIARAVGNNVYVVWEDATTAPGGGANIVFARSLDGAASFSPEAVLDDPLAPVSASIRPSLAVDPRTPAASDDVVHVAWEDQRNGSQIYAASSADAGASFVAAVRVSSSSGDPVPGRTRWPAATSFGGGAAIVYQNDAGGSWHAYVSLSIDNGASWSADARLLDGGSGPAEQPLAVPIDDGGGLGVLAGWSDRRTAPGVHADPFVVRVTR